MLENRQENLLKLIVENYIKTAEPVGSKFLVSEYHLDLSDATVRNEMRELEELGFLMHPHTSAGRIPTELGYRLYVEKLMAPVNLSKKIKTELEKVSSEASTATDRLKRAGKVVAEDMENAVLVAFGPHSVYYTGLSGLFSQPEFRDVSQTINVSEMFDRCEELIDDVFDCVSVEQTATLIGSDNPLGNFSSLVVTRLPDDFLFMIMGPLRMDYARGKLLTETILAIFNR